MTLNDLNDLFRHMEWADASVWRAVLASDAARADTKLRELFYHVHMVQRAFLRVWQGGMSFHGGLLGVFAAMWWWSRRRGR